MNDYMVRATAADSSIRAFAITSKHSVQEAATDHGTSPVMTAALGRLLSAGLMMGSMMKGEKDMITLQIQCDGPARGIVVTADANGHAKGYVNEPDVDIPLKYAGKLDVGGALGNGYLSVVKDMGLREPYVGQCDLQTGEIAEDLTYYFAVSEQTPSAVGLGVLVDTDCTVKQAGGFIIQLLPFAEESVIDRLEQRLGQIDSVTDMLERGLTPEGILEEILGDLGVVITGRLPAEFRCDCSKEKISAALATLSKDDMDEMIESNEEIEVKCHFCNKAYKFSVDDLREIRKK